MKQKIFTLRNAMAALLMIVLALCLSLGLWFAATPSLRVYADDASDTETPDVSESDEEEGNWVIAPSITGWTWGSYSYDQNLVKAEANKEGTLQLTLYLLVSVVDNGELKERKDLVSFLDDDDRPVLLEYENGEKMPEEIGECFAELDAGKYSLIVSLKDGGLSKEIEFTVSVQTNSWVTEGEGVNVTEKLSVASWAQGEYDIDENKFIAIPKFGGSLMKFEIYSESAPQNLLLTFFTNGNGEIIDYYDSDGETLLISRESVIQYLNNLAVGTYFFFATVSDGNSTNYPLKSGSVSFSVLPKNTWVKEPSIASWKWNNFDSSFNVPVALASAGSDTVYFRICSFKDNGEDNGGWNFEIDEWVEFDEYVEIDGKSDYISFCLVDGELPDYVADKLNSLNVGEYGLFATIPATEEYGGLTGGSMFNVLQVNNTITRLTITEWNWREYSESKNVIDIAVAYGDTENIKFTVCRTKLNGEMDGGIEALTGFTIDSTGKVIGAGHRDALRSLDAGEYWLIAETENNSANFSEAEFTIRFKVNKPANYWTTTPYIMQWTWGGYNAEENVIYGAAKYNESLTVYYGIFTDSKCETSSAVEGLSKFTVGGSDWKKVTQLLEKLDANTYYLKGWIENTTENYDDIESVTPFTVQKASNGWEISPYILTWSYGEYNNTINLIKAEAQFGSETRFSIYTDEELTKAVILGDDDYFTLDENGLVPDNVAQQLKALNANTTYYLLAVVASTENFYGINDGSDKVPVPFEVIPLVNSWTDAPGIISWSEGHFNGFDNILSGTAKQGDVTFTVRNDSGKTLFVIRTTKGLVTAVQKPNGESAKLSDLNTLAVGSYELLAEVAATDNYSALSTVAYFAVYEDSVGLTGIIAAAVTLAVIDVIVAGACIVLVIIRRKKIEEQYRKMIEKELRRR